jgi:SOS response regulatory protein OraA/RecX
MSKASIIATTLTATGIIAATSIGIVSADSTNTNVGSSTIPKTVFHQERLQAASEVLNTSTSSIQTARKDHTVKQLISSAGLNDKEYAQKLKTQLSSDLEAKGYSQSDITIALQHHKDKTNK